MSTSKPATAKTAKPKNGAAHTPAPKIALEDRFIKTGVFLAPFHALDENPTLAIERDMELVQHLDRLNYHEAWIGEHHSAGFEIIACPEMFIAGAAPVTRNIRLGTGVVSLPYHNPFTLASRMMQLDHQTRGRAMFGVGPGSLIYDADKIGLKAADQRRRMDESLDVLMRLMRNETVTQKTDWYNLNEARLQLQPYSQPMMEMAVAASRSPVGYVASGKHGLGMLSIGGTSDDALKAYAQNWGIHEETAARRRPNARSPQVAHRHVRPCRADARTGQEGCRVRPASTSPSTSTMSPRSRSCRPASRSLRVPDQGRRRLHRHAGRLHPAFRADLEGLGRRLRRHPAARPQLGRLAGDLQELRADGALRPSALPANANAQRVWSYDDAAKKHETAGAESQAAVQREIEKYAAAKGKAAGAKSW